MFGPLFLIIYRLVALCAAVMPREWGRALRARCALRFSSLSDGGLDDDFVEELFQLVRAQPELLDQLEARLKGNGIFAIRRRMTIDSIRHALASGATSTF